jgi:hypothetical protein
MFSYDAMTLESVMAAVNALPERTSTYLTTCMTGISDTYRNLDHTFDGMIARMLHNGSSVQSLEDSAFLRARTDVAWEVYADWEEDPTEEDWSTGTKALRLNMKALTHHTLTGFDYDPAVSLRYHDERTQSQCIALFNLAVEINATAEAAALKSWQGWSSSRDAIRSEALFIEDATVAQIVVDNSYAEDTLVAFIGEHGYDPEQLLSVFGNGVPVSLIDGAL